MPRHPYTKAPGESTYTDGPIPRTEGTRPARGAAVVDGILRQPPRVQVAPGSGRIVIAARWLAQRGVCGEPVKLQGQVDPRGAPPGTPAQFAIYAWHEGKRGEQVATVSGAVEGSFAASEWTYTHPDQDPDPYRWPFFDFDFTVRGETARAPAIPWVSDVAFLLVDEEGRIMPELPYLAVLANGDERRGRTDEEAFCHLRSLPPGKVEISILAATPLEEEEPEAAADADDEPPAEDAEKRLEGPAWSAEHGRDGDEVGLSVEAEGIDDGTAVTFAIWEHDADGEHDAVGEVAGHVEGGRATASWTYAYVPDEDDVPDEQDENEPYTLPELFFVARAGDVESAPSPLLEFRSEVAVQLVTASGDPVPAGTRFTFRHEPSGRVFQGRSDTDGWARVSGVAPGPYELTLDAG